MCAAINILFPRAARRWSVSVRINSNQLRLVVRELLFWAEECGGAICQTCCAGYVLAVTSTQCGHHISADRGKLQMSETPPMTDECTLSALTSEYIALTARNQRAFHISRIRAIEESILRPKSTKILWSCCGHAKWVENSTMPRTTSRLQLHFKNQTNQM